MPIGTRKHDWVNRRVEIPAYADNWMKGARFGTVERVKVGKGNYLDPCDYRAQTILFVRLDHPSLKSKCYRYYADDCSFL